MRIALAGDTMLGRGVAERIGEVSPSSLVAPAVVAAFQEADVAILNLECCISERGTRWRAPGKPFFFRAPPRAVELLNHLHVDCVTLANNHALDFGYEALLDTLGHLDSAGIAVAGAGADLDRARAPAVLESRGFRLAVLGATDHPADFASRSNAPGVALVDLEEPAWLVDAIGRAEADAVLVTPHWGPNMAVSPIAAIRHAAQALLQAGAALVAGHSAHVFHGVAPNVVYDLGDFIDDYRVDPVLRNDLGIVVLADVDVRGIVRLEAVPLKLDYAYTGVAESADADWVERRLRTASAELGSAVRREGGRLVVDWEQRAPCA
jgi:poly-gamma-glutamate capsule biosynthesis protein CapA/YwtB (metallophosphatase superfamily)